MNVDGFTVIWGLGVNGTSLCWEKVRWEALTAVLASERWWNQFSEVVGGQWY